MKNLKIAVFHNLPSGGAKRALYDLTKYLTKSGHLIDVFVPSSADETFLPLKEVVNTVHIFPVRKTITGLIYSTFHYIPPINMEISLRDLERTNKEIADVINKKDYDVVFSEQDQYIISPFFLKFVKKPTVYYCQQPSRHNEAILENISQEKTSKYPQLIRKIWHKYFASKLSEIDRENASFAGYILANSYFSRESIMRSYGLNSFVSYLGVDTEIFKPIEIPKENFVLSVGSCGPAKGFDFIIKSLARIDSKICPKFIIVSNMIDKEWKNYLEQLAIKFNVKLEIKNLVPNEELVQLYNKAKLVVYAPYLEPFGLVPLEAMACGTPVVGVKEGGIRETVIHQKTGLLTERDESLFAESIVKLMMNEQKMEELSQNAIKYVNNFWTLEYSGKRLLWHLKRVLNSEN